MTRRAAVLGAVLGAAAAVGYGLAAASTEAAVRDIVLIAVLPVAFLIAGSVACISQPANTAARRLVLVGGLHLVAFWLGAEACRAADAGHAAWMWNLIAGVAFLGGMASLLGLFAVFPDGRATSRSRIWIPRGVAWASIALPMLNALLGTAQPLVVDLAERTDETVAPFSTGTTEVFGALSGLLLLSPVVGLLWVIASYRRARSPVERLRMRWPLFGVALLASAMILTRPATAALGEGGWTVVFVSTALLLPASLLVAIVRYRLFDVQVLVRRSVVFVLLVGVISAGYAGVAGGLGMAAGRFSVAAAVAATVGAALAFQPIRQKLEHAARRRLFGARDDPLSVVRELSMALESTLDIRSVVPLIERAAQAAVRAPAARISFDSEEGPAPAPDDLVVALEHAGTNLGQLVLPSRTDPYEPEEVALVETLARHASLALSNARLTADLEVRLRELQEQAAALDASRRRIISAQEVERRRIERNIHDGVQQQVVALLAGLETLRTRLPLDPVDTATSLRQLQNHARAAITDLRTLASGIHPAVLTDEGLAAAVAALTSRLPIEVRLQISPKHLPRLPAEAEAAAYFVAAEGITNAMKHAGVDVVDVALTVNGFLRVEVTDHGSGFDPRAGTGNGLQGMRDRIEGVGGQLDVQSSPLAGTRLTAAIPLQRPVSLPPC